MANNDDTAAATIPRGATQLKNHLSALFKEEPNADTQTLTGLATNITTSHKPRPPKPRSSTAAEPNRAANKINRAEINSTVKVSLNSRISAISTPRILASQIPITVTVNKPDSSCNRLEPTKTANTIVNTAVFCR